MILDFAFVNTASSNPVHLSITLTQLAWDTPPTLSRKFGLNIAGASSNYIKRRLNINR